MNERQAKAFARNVGRLRAEVAVTADTSSFDRGAKKVKATTAELSGKRFNFEFKGDTGNFDRAARKVKTTTAELAGKKYNLEFRGDTGDFDRAAKKVKATTAELSGKKFNIEFKADLDDKAAKAKAEAFQRSINRVIVHAQFEPDTKKVDAEFARFARKAVSIKVDGDTDPLIRSVKIAELRIKSIHPSIKVDADTKNVNKLTTDLNRLKGGLTGLAGPLRNFGLLWSLIKFPAILAGLNLASVALAALSAQAIALVSALVPLVGLAPAVAGGFLAIAQGVGTAMLAFRGIKDAVKALGDVQANAGKDALAAAKQQSAAMKLVVSAQQGVQNASVSLRDSQQNLRDAQQSLNQARKDAVQNLIDLRIAENRLRLDQRGAVLDLKDAEIELQKVLTNPASTQLEKDRARLRVDQARQSIVEIKRQIVANKSQIKLGVEGSAQVVAAKKAELQAQKGVGQAVQGLRDAIQNLTVAQQQAREKTDTLSSSQEKLKEAMDKLSPAGQRFARFLFSLRGELVTLSHLAAQSFLPGLQASLQRIAQVYFPMFRESVTRTGRVLSQLATAGADLVTSGPFRRDFQTISRNNATVLKVLGQAFLNVFGAMHSLIAAAAPLTLWLSRLVLRGSELFRQWVAGARSSGKLAAFFGRTKDVVETLVGAVGHLFHALGPVFSAALPDGMNFLHLLENLAKRFDAWTHSVAGQNRIKKFFDDARPVIAAVGRLLSAIFKVFTGLGKGFSPSLIRTLDKLSTEFVPAIGKLTKNVSGKFIENLTSLATNIAKILAATGGDTGSLTSFVGNVAKLTGVLASFVDKHPAFGSFVVNMLALAGIAKATGLSSMAGSLLSISTSITNLTTRRATLKALRDMAAGDVPAKTGGLTRIKDTLKGLPTLIPLAFNPLSLAVAGALLVLGGLAFAIVKFPKLFASIGSSIVHVFSGLLGPLDEIVRSVFRHRDDIVHAFMAIPGMIRNLPGQIGAVFSTVGGAVSRAFGSVPRIVGSALATMGGAVRTAFGRVQSAVGGSMVSIGAAIRTAWGRIVAVVGDAVVSMGGAVRTAFGRVQSVVGGSMVSIGGAIRTAWERIIAVVGGAVAAMGGAVRTAFGRVLAVIAGAMVAIGAAIRTAWGRILSVIASFLSQIGGAIRTAWGRMLAVIGDFLQRIGAAIRTAWGRMLAVIASFLSQIGAAIRTAWGRILAVIGDFLVRIGNAIKTATGRMFAVISAWVGSTFNRIRAGFGSIFTTIGTTMSRIGGNIKSATGKIFGVVSGWIGSLVNRVKSGFGAIWNTVKSIWEGIRSFIAGKVTWVVRFAINPFIRGINTVGKPFGFHVNEIKGFAEGGAVRGRGGTKSDSIPARLSRDEHVMTAEEVRNAGGHRAVEAMRAALRTSAPRRPKPGQLVTGGRPTITPGDQKDDKFQRGLQFAKSMAGRPYHWGGVGPGGFDCSGFMGAILNKINTPGKSPYRRIFTTANIGAVASKVGLRPGNNGAFVIGSSKNAGGVGHMAGTLLGINVESSSSGRGVRVGGGARGANSPMFNEHYVAGPGFGGFDLLSVIKKVGKLFNSLRSNIGKGLTGTQFGAKFLGGAAGALGKAVKDGLIKKAKDFITSIFGGLGGDTIKGGFAGEGQLKRWIQTALLLTNTPLNWAAAIYRRIIFESGGNPRAINRTDSNARAGHPSQGLMQTIPSTFNAFHQPGTSNNILDPVANIAAAIRYIKSRYGSISRIDPPVRGYKSGAWKILGDQFAQLHAGEMVVPKATAEVVRAGVAGSGGSSGGGVYVAPGGVVINGASMTPAELEQAVVGGLNNYARSHRKKTRRGGRV